MICCCFSALSQFVRQGFQPTLPGTFDRDLFCISWTACLSLALLCIFDFEASVQKDLDSLFSSVTVCFLWSRLRVTVVN